MNKRNFPTGPLGYAESDGARVVERIIDGKPEGDFFIEVTPTSFSDAEDTARIIALVPEMLNTLLLAAAALDMTVSNNRVGWVQESALANVKELIAKTKG